MDLQKDLKNTFQSKLIEITKEKKITQKFLCDKLGYPQSTISSWYQGKSIPKAGKLMSLSDLLGVPLSFWTDDPEVSDSTTDQNYYLDEETRKTAEEIRANDDLKALFDTARDASPEDLKAVHSMLLALKRKEQHSDD